MVTGALVALVGVFAQAALIDYENVDASAQDGTGRVWGIVRGEDLAEPDRLSTWSGEAWVRETNTLADFRGTTGFPQSLHAQADASVLCIWRTFDEKVFQVTRSKGTSTSWMMEFDVVEGRPEQMLMDRKGQPWVVAMRTVYTGIPGGPAKDSLHLSSLQFHPGRQPEGERPDYAPTRLLEDPLGRIWCWGQLDLSRPWEASLRGAFLLADGGRTRLETIPGLPDAPWTHLSVKDENTLFVGVLGAGLFEMDCTSLTARQVATPDPEPFQYVQQVFRSGDLSYVVSDSKLALREDVHTGGVLEVSDGGAWRILIEGMDVTQERSFAQTREGLWIGTVRYGLYFIEMGGTKAVHLDWRRGLPLRAAQAIYVLPDERLLVIQHSAYQAGVPSTYAATAEELLREPEVAGGVEAYISYCSPVQDAQGRIWAPLLKDFEFLSMWDGKDWRGYPLPPEAQMEHLYSLTVDSRGRIWWWEWEVEDRVRRDLEQGAAYLFDPEAESWETFPTYLKALEAQTGMPDFQFLGNPFPHPVFAPDGRIAFSFSSHRSIFYFDTEVWHSFDGDDLDGGRVYRLFLDEEGRICGEGTKRDYQNGGSQDYTYVLNNSLAWEAHPLPVPRIEPKRLPEGVSGRARHEAAITGAYGFTWCWYTEHLNLYRFAPGLGLSPALFKSSEAHPFLSGNMVMDAYLDLEGNTVLATDNNLCVILSQEATAPETLVSPEEDQPDAFRVRLSSPGTRDPRFIWRLDGGAWSSPESSGAVRLIDLPAGAHRFEAVTLNGRLELDPTPALAEFSVAIDPVSQVAAWIEALRNPVFQRREEAIQALARVPDRSIPALEAARATASGDVLWWIDTALQEIQRAR